ncbi:hypothetical protein Lal_00016270 [Lupinus albus]|nr:hypothetical protein Lal_00016270 [Lupinus albus]
MKQTSTVSHSAKYHRTLSHCNPMEKFASDNNNLSMFECFPAMKITISTSFHKSLKYDDD